MSKRSPVVIATVTIVAFLLIDQLNVSLYRWLRGDSQGTARILIFIAVIYGSMIIGPALVAAWLVGARKVREALGLHRSFVTGLGVGLAGTTVMLGYFILTARLQIPDEPVRTLLQGAVLPGFGEELFYRAFLFGFLFRYARWGFLPASLLVAVLFGAAHLYQSSNAQEALGIFAITAGGAVWFSWLYAEWDFNVWVPTFFHLFMNAWWEIFAVSDSALGSTGANLVRLLVIVLSVVLTVVVVRKRGDRLRVRGRRWLGGAA